MFYVRLTEVQAALVARCNLATTKFVALVTTTVSVVHRLPSAQIRTCPLRHPVLRFGIDIAPRGVAMAFRLL